MIVHPPSTMLRIALFVSLLIAAVFFSGCITTDAQGRRIGVQDSLPPGTPKGYAEFIVVGNMQLHPYGLSVVREGETDRVPADAAGTRHYLRIAVPPGRQRFVVKRQKWIEVPITRGMVTPVQIVLGNTQAYAHVNYTEAHQEIGANIGTPVAPIPIPGR
jgi:hypothetical protein